MNTLSCFSKQLPHPRVNSLMAQNNQPASNLRALGFVSGTELNSQIKVAMF